MEFSPLHQFAIRLACIHASDRAWLLAQLDTVERAQVDALLQEIDELGLARDPAVVAAVLSDPTGRFDSESVMPTDVAVHAQVRGAGHPFWGALLLQMHSPAQRRTVMSSLPQGDLLRRWDHVFADQSVPPALVAALSEHIAGAQEATDA